MKPISAQASAAPKTPIARQSRPGREDRERRDDRDQHDHAAHRRRAGLAEVPLRPVVAHVLAELAPAQELDELRREEDADQQRGGAADQDLVPSAPPRARSATRSSATPREPLTSTVSPGAQARRAAAPRPSAASLGVEVLAAAEALAGPRRARPDRDEQRDAGRVRLLARARGGSAPRRASRARACRRARRRAGRGPSRRARPARRASTSGWRCSSR